MTDQNSTWDLSPLLPDENEKTINAKIAELQNAATEFINKWKNRQDYLSDESVLLEALQDLEKWYRNFSTGGALWYYFFLRSTQDKLDPKIKAWQNKISDVAIKLENDSQFFLLNLSKVPKETQEKFVKSEKLTPFRHFLETLFANAKHLLSEKEESILNLKSVPAFSNWVKMTSSFLAEQTGEIIDEDGKKIEAPFPQIASLTSSQNKTTRDSAAAAFNAILAKFAQTAENEINSILADKKINDELRGFKRPDESRHLSDDVSDEVVDTLIEAVSSEFEVAKKFYELKAKLFKVPKLAYHERNVEFGSVEKTYTFPDSCQLVKKVFTKLDPQFEQIFSKFLANRQIDVYPKKGKESGAFCDYYLISQPTYILLNHTDKLRDVLTLAHELGHGINNELVKLSQNALNFGTPLSTAEVASTFMEDFVLQELMQQADEETKLSLMMTKLNDDISSIFRQIACYQFEQELHSEFRKIGYLSKEKIGEIFQKHMISYMGDFVEQSEGAQNWWVYWTHIRNFFYVYSYASGLLISKSLQASVKADPKFIIQVKKFLSAGESKAPREIFLELGIDINKREFWEKGIGEIKELFKETESLAKKLGKLE